MHIFTSGGRSAGRLASHGAGLQEKTAGTLSLPPENRPLRKGRQKQGC